MSRVLVLAPHADDEVLGCGGTIAKHIDDGDKVYVAVMTNASVGAPELFDEQQILSLRKEAKLAHIELKVSETIFFDFPAPKLEQFPLYKIADEIRKLIQRIDVDLLYVPNRGDLHLDHGVVFTSALVAARPVPGQSVKQIMAYETLSETEWGDPTSNSIFSPNCFCVLEKSHLDAKIAAMKCYKSQLKLFPNARSLKAIRNLAGVRGATVGSYFAEAFVLIRQIK